MGIEALLLVGPTEPATQTFFPEIFLNSSAASLAISDEIFESS